MAKVIRKNYVFKKYGRWWRYLPRRHDGRMQYDYEAEQNSPKNFEDPMPCDPPVLWVGWLHRDTSKMSKGIQDQVKILFGNSQPGEMNIFKNTASTNKELWKVKHLIDIRPISFPDGEPTLENIKNLEILPDGSCVIDEKFAPDPEGVQLFDPTKQFTMAYLASRLKSRDRAFKDVYEDNVYNPANVTIYD